MASARTHAIGQRRAQLLRGFEPSLGVDAFGEQLQEADDFAACDHRDFEQRLVAEMVVTAEFSAIGAVEMRLAALQGPAGARVDGFVHVFFVAAPGGRQHQPVTRIVEDVERSRKAGHQFGRRGAQHGVGVAVVRRRLQQVGHFEQPRHLLARGVGRNRRGVASDGVGRARAEGKDQRGDRQDAAANLQQEDHQRADGNARLVGGDIGIGPVEHRLDRLTHGSNLRPGIAREQQALRFRSTARSGQVDSLRPDRKKRIDDFGGIAGRVAHLHRIEPVERGGAPALDRLDGVEIATQIAAALAQHEALHFSVGAAQRLMHRAHLLAGLAQRDQRLLLQRDVGETHDGVCHHGKDQDDDAEREQPRPDGERG